VIGRSSDADVRVDDPGVSRHHAELRIQWSGTRYTLELVDLGSTNGSVVDGRRVSTAPLRDGSRITVGGTTLQLELDEARLTTG
jgi:pSer/pThr/pTyr-binding forkhead associated (FHA) protein